MTPDCLQNLKARVAYHSHLQWNPERVWFLIPDLQEVITALEAAQERIATLKAEVQRVTSDHQYVIGHNAGFDDAWAHRGEEIADQDADIKRLEGALLSMGQAWQALK